MKQMLCFSMILAAITMQGCATTQQTPGEPRKKELTRLERARMLIEVANGALAEGDATGALENLLRAEKDEPNLPELHHSKAIAFFFKRDLSTALQEVRRAVELKPDYSDANNTLGKILLDLGRSEESVAPLLKAANDPIYREAYKPLTSLGILYYRQGEYGKAESYLSRAILDAPAVACVAYYYRGHVKLHDSLFSDALSDYDNAGRRACANFADAHLAMGMAYERSRQYDLARRKYAEIETRFPRTKAAEQAMNHLRALP